MPEINARDAITMYAGSLLLYKGSPVKVKTIDENLKVNYTDLETGRSGTVQFNYENFKPVVGRVGYVNHGGHAFYVMRSPSRVYKVGLATDNTKFKYIDHHRHHPTFVRALDKVCAFTSGSYVNAIANDYPTLSVSLRVAKESGGSCAFDKQFAVDFERNIYFKGKVVGAIPGRYSTKSRIEFLPEFAFLSFPLEASRENTPSTFEIA